MTIANPTAGIFPLTSVDRLPNVSVAFPGEHWSNRIAQGAIVPGEAVYPVNISGKLGVRRAVSSGGSPDPLGRVGIATRIIEHPDLATNSVYTTSLGPNEIVNRQINSGEYVHVYYSGAFHLTLVKPRAWVPSELVGWDDAATRPTGKAGTGAWNLAASEAAALFEVMEFRPYSSDGHEGILTVRSLRGQF